MPTARLTTERCYWGGESVTMATADLLAALELGPSTAARWPMTLARQIGGRLDRIGVALEPDRRYGPKGPSAEGVVVLYRFPNGGAVDGDRPEYATARTEVEAAIAGGATDVDPTFSRIDPIGVGAKRLAKLATDERFRLHAYAIALFEETRRTKT